MVKVNGAAYPGVWVERKVSFVTVTFAATVAATAAYSGFNIVDSCVVKALQHVAQRGTILGVSQLSASGLTFQVMLGFAEGFFSDNVGSISTANAVTGKAYDITVPTAPVAVSDLTTTFNVSFAYWDGSLPAATLANGALASGPGNTPAYRPV